MKSGVLLLCMSVATSLGTGSIAPAAAAPSPCTYLTTQINAAPPGPVFLVSYPTAGDGPLKDTAFLYDNAAAAIALVGCNEVPRARRIGDAILIAQNYDRYWHDGRLRDAYLAGAVSKPVKLSGWWDPIQNRFFEDAYQTASDNGNMAWAMLALLALDRVTNDPRYRAGALRIGTWVERWRDRRGAGGFTGGTFGEEPSPLVLHWKSTEHNTDLAAAFRALAETTGDKHWLEPARAAEGLVRAMWRPMCNCFAVGSGEDGVTPNTLLALDAQIWPLLALGNAAPYRAVLATVQQQLSQSGGYAYSEAREGLWTEGTGQMALLAALSGRREEAAALNRVIATMRTPDGAYYASNRSALPTGFMLQTDPTKAREYFHTRHLAAAAWAALAERRFNPFTGERALPR
ncbi:MAG TPA: hypothetical protein VII56_17330 [Rhizomicrobium sp.]